MMIIHVHVHVHVCSNAIVLNQPYSQTRLVLGFLVNDLRFIITMYMYMYMYGLELRI